MGRRPCCDKIGLKKGPWSVEEDQILINYITLHGHSNWRALPKLAGLLRCGKSCRLRWINYLRPDIKRGNFTLQEEETIINLHQILGNRWSTIASKLPGRTDNEIKNVWHTHLKKRLHQSKDQTIGETVCENGESIASLTNTKRPSSPQQHSSSSSTNMSAVTTSNNKDSATSSKDVLAFIDESFWSEVVSTDCKILGEENKEIKLENLEDSLLIDKNDKRNNNYSKLYNDDMEFWFELLTNSNRKVGEIISNISEF